MTTQSDLKRFAAPLLERNPDLAQMKRLIVFKPMHHFLRGICLDGAWSRGMVRPRWFTMNLFQPHAFVQLTLGADIYPSQPVSWNLSNVADSFDFCEQAEKVALPLLRPVETLDDFYRFTTQENFFRYGALNVRYMMRILVEAACGDFAAADMCSARLLAVPNGWSRDEHIREEYELTTQQLCPLIAARDRAGIGRLLRSWEERAVKKMKLEKVWEPSPLPVEMQRD